MVTYGPIRALLYFAGSIIEGGPASGWSCADLRCGRGIARDFRMLDGTMSSVAIIRDGLMIYAYSGSGRDYTLRKPMHVLLVVSEESLSYFYPIERAREIFSAYVRYNRF